MLLFESIPEFVRDIRHRISILLLSQFARKALRRSARNVFISSYMRERAEALVPQSRPRNVVISNGIEQGLIASTFNASPPSRPPIRGRLVAIQGDMPYKNTLILADVLYRLVAHCPAVDWHLVLIGSGEWITFKAACERLGVLSRVRFAGQLPRTQVLDELRSALCLVFPSLCEGFGNPPIEAMAVGCPVVASQRTAIPEIVGEGGVLVDPTSPESIAVAILDLQAEPQRRSVLVERGRQWVRQFTWRTSAARMYEELMAIRSPPISLCVRSAKPH